MGLHALELFFRLLVVLLEVKDSTARVLEGLRLPALLGPPAIGVTLAAPKPPRPRRPET